MIRLDNVAKHFGGRTLFSGVNWTLPPGKRVGLVGPNGAGKTTLFRMLSGEMATDEGAIHRAKGTSLGLLAQDVGHIGDASLIDFVLEGRPDLMALERKMDALTERAHAATGPEAAALGEELAHVTDAFERAGGYRFRSDGQSILLGMGFKPHELERPATELSGGWRVRLVLSKLLLQRPDFLLMDEPTNHLDVPSVEWLEGFLAHYEGTVVVISHDRYFLNRLVNQIAAIEPQGIYVQDGNYDDYVNAWAERAEQLEKLKTRQDREIKELERFVERFRAKATKAKQAQSRAKRLEKIDRIQTLSTKKVVRGFSFAEGPRSGRIVVEAKALGCRFGDHVVYDNLDLLVERGARVAIVGPNGAGKSTLLRLIADELVPNAGSVELGHNVMMSYFGQHQVELLDHSRTVLEEMEACAPVDEVPRCRSILGSFLFTGDDVQKKISVLSGGERNRLALAKLLLHPTNFLLLDEPTNHLDMDSRDVLLEALDAFDGTLMVVSHDRHFINEIATQVVHIEDERALHYDGDFEYYHEKHAERVASAGESQEPLVEAAQAAHSKKDQRRAEAERRAQLKKLLGDKPKHAAALEADIERLEAEVTRLETALADPGFYDGATPDEIADAGRTLDATRATLESTMDEWAEKTEEIERIEAEELE